MALVFIYTTVGSQEDARKLAELLIKQQLAACVSVCLYYSCSVGIFGDMYLYRFIGQELFYEFRPFDEAEVSAVDLFVETDVEDLTFAFYAVEVEMIDRVTIAVKIFVYDGKGG